MNANECEEAKVLTDDELATDFGVIETCTCSQCQERRRFQATIAADRKEIEAVDVLIETVRAMPAANFTHDAVWQDVQASIAAHRKEYPK